MPYRLLDLFSGAGGAAMGYHQAGFDEIVGVDIKPQPRYPFHFVQNDALELLQVLIDGGRIDCQCCKLSWSLRDFDAIHASPPCQGYSIMNNLPWMKGREYPLLILPTMELLEKTGKPYVLENVMGARNGAKGLKKRGVEEHGLKAGYLCGQMFGLPFYRHRLFASNWFWLAPGHTEHKRQIAMPVGHSPTPGQRRNPVNTAWLGHQRGWKLAAEVMGISWMTRAELTQAIPPAYTSFMGLQLRKYLEGAPNEQSYLQRR